MQTTKRFIVLSLIFMLTLATFGCGAKEAAENEEVVAKPIPVEAVESKAGTFTKAIILSGTTEPKSTITVMPKVAGAEEVVQLNVETGSRISAGQVIAVLDQKTASLRLNMAQTAYEDTLRQYERNKVLFDSGAVPQATLEQLELGLNQAQNELDSAQIAYNNTIIKAPITGVVTSVGVEEGALASAQTPIATIVDAYTLEIKTSINEMQVSKVKAGDDVNILIPAVGSEVFEGKIKSISAAMNPQIKAFPLVISLENQDNKVKAGMYAEVEIVTDIREEAIIVPAQAVISRNGDSKVYVVQEGKAVMKLVEVGMSNGNETEIVSGLNKGELIITKGNEDVVDGDLVTVIKRGEN